MGTTVRVELWHADRGKGEALIDEVLDELHRIDARMSPYKKTSELFALNGAAVGQPLSVSRELLTLVQRAQRLSVATDGAFDITFASAGFAYDFRTGRRPSARRLAVLQPRIDYRSVSIDGRVSTITLTKPGVKIDLGGIAKGYAVERSVALLRRHGVRHASVTAGGDTRVLGDRRGRPWIVGIRHPRSRNKLVTRLALVDEAISTSGDYERFFEENGVRYHHILNPATGDSARRVQSVTVIGPDATRTDGLSTSVFVLGAERGLALINRTAGYEAIVVDRHGELRYSQGLEAQ